MRPVNRFVSLGVLLTFGMGFLGGFFPAFADAPPEVTVYYRLPDPGAAPAIGNQFSDLPPLEKERVYDQFRQRTYKFQSELEKEATASQAALAQIVQSNQSELSEDNQELEAELQRLQQSLEVSSLPTESQVVPLLSDASSEEGGEIRSQLNTVSVAERSVQSYCRDARVLPENSTGCLRFASHVHDLRTGLILSDRLATQSKPEAYRSLMDTLKPYVDALKGFSDGVLKGSISVGVGIAAAAFLPAPATAGLLAYGIYQGISALALIEEPIDRFAKNQWDKFLAASSEEQGAMVGDLTVLVAGIVFGNNADLVTQGVLKEAVRLTAGRESALVALRQSASLSSLSAAARNGVSQLASLAPDAAMGLIQRYSAPVAEKIGDTFGKFMVSSTGEGAAVMRGSDFAAQYPMAIERFAEEAPKVVETLLEGKPVNVYFAVPTFFARRITQEGVGYAGFREFALEQGGRAGPARSVGLDRITTILEANRSEKGLAEWILLGAEYHSKSISDFEIFPSVRNPSGGISLHHTNLDNLNECFNAIKIIEELQ